MRFAREIRLRRVKCLRAWVDLFHFTFRPCGTFHNAQKALFHICRKANISLPCAELGRKPQETGKPKPYRRGRVSRPLRDAVGNRGLGGGPLSRLRRQLPLQGSLQVSQNTGVGATLAVARVGHGRKPGEHLIRPFGAPSPQGEGYGVGSSGKGSPSGGAVERSETEGAHTAAKPTVAGSRGMVWGALNVGWWNVWVQPLAPFRLTAFGTSP